MTATITNDLRVTNEGSLFMVAPLTEAAKDWVDANVNLEPWMWMGAAFAVDYHYIEGLLEGMLAEGFEIEML